MSIIKRKIKTGYTLQEKMWRNHMDGDTYVTCGKLCVGGCYNTCIQGCLTSCEATCSGSLERKCEQNVL